ncbi:hypothetical protein SSCG_04254 [Streptomyces clavuligerus]|nr:hypothetical protein SSCG_04254 [Streptomyces clavuligerus]
MRRKSARGQGIDRTSVPRFLCATVGGSPTVHHRKRNRYFRVERS